MSTTRTAEGEAAHSEAKAYGEDKLKCQNSYKESEVVNSNKRFTSHAFTSHDFTSHAFTS